MTMQEMYSLQEAIQHALDATNDGSTDEVVTWLRLHRRDVLDANEMTIERCGLGHLVREFRKKHKTPREAVTVRQICMDLGLEELDIDLEISVPRGDGIEICDWIDLDDATIDNLDAHALLLDEKATATAAKATNVRFLRQKAALIVPGRTDIPLRELRRIARGEAA